MDKLLESLETEITFLTKSKELNPTKCGVTQRSKEIMKQLNLFEEEMAN